MIGFRPKGTRALQRLLSMSRADELVRRLSPNSLTIFCYHGVVARDAPASHWLLIPEDMFRRQMQYVQRHYNCVPLEQGVADLHAGRIHRPTACVTFDDGYRNNLSVAKPILASLGIPATVFLATGLIGTDYTLWTTKLGLALSDPALRPRILRELGLYTGEASVASHRQIDVVEDLKRLPAATRRAMVARIEPHISRVITPDAFTFLNWQEVHALTSGGLVGVGSHTVNHDIVARLSDAELEAEIGGSQGELAARLGYRPRVFAFPNGRADDIDGRSFPVLRRHGIEIAVTTIPGTNRGLAPSLALRRVVIGGNDSFDAFTMRACGLESGILRKHAILGAAAAT